MDLRAVLDALFRVELAIGLACGVVAAALCLVAPVRRRGWGVAAAAAVVAGFALAGLLGRTVPAEPGWLRPVAVLAVFGAGGLLAAGGRLRAWRQVLPVLVAGTAFGVFVTVPDTEMALVLFGVTVAVAVAAVAGSWSMGGVGGFAVGGLLVWVVAAEGASRPGSVVGGLACLGVLACAPLARRTARGRPGWRAGAVLIAGHAGAVLVAGRVAGMREQALAALPWAALALVVAYGTVLAADWLSGGTDRATLSRSPRSAGPRSREQRDRHD